MEGKGDSYEEQPLKERIRVRREKKVNKLWEVRQGREEKERKSEREISRGGLG